MSWENLGNLKGARNPRELYHSVFFFAPLNQTYFWPHYINIPPPLEIKMNINILFLPLLPDSQWFLNLIPNRQISQLCRKSRNPERNLIFFVCFGCWNRETYCYISLVIALKTQIEGVCAFCSWKQKKMCKWMGAYLVSFPLETVTMPSENLNLSH